MNAAYQLRNEASYTTTFDKVDKVAWAVDTAPGKSVQDFNIQCNFDQTRVLIDDGQYVPLPAHSEFEKEVGFELIDDLPRDDDGNVDATPEEVAAWEASVAEQDAAIAEARAAGMIPFHYETVYVRYAIKATDKNPNRRRSTRTRGRATRRSGIAG